MGNFPFFHPIPKKKFPHLSPFFAIAPPPPPPPPIGSDGGLQRVGVVLSAATQLLRNLKILLLNSGPYKTRCPLFPLV